jgi:hypothetical protein
MSTSCQGKYSCVLYHGDNRARSHVLHEGGEEGLGNEVLVVLLEEGLICQVDSRSVGLYGQELELGHGLHVLQCAM